MEIIAFTGPPGSGKSDRALIVAQNRQAECIIDDGILIYQNRIVAGKSAKREPSRLGAVRRALFFDAQQAKDVQKQIAVINPQHILILGTSDRMVDKITEALNLPRPSTYIHIEDVAKPEEIKQARESRNKEGKHVIPVPTMELQPYFRGYLIDSLRFLRTLTKGTGKRKGEERSVVRPVFSYYGKLTFSNRVISSLVHYATQGIHDGKISHIYSEKSIQQMNGIILFMDFTVKGKTPMQIKDLVTRMRDNIQREIEYTTGMSLEMIKINVITDVAR